MYVQLPAQTQPTPSLANVPMHAGHPMGELPRYDRVNWVPLAIVAGLVGITVYAIRKNKNFKSDVATHIAASALYDILT